MLCNCAEIPDKNPCLPPGIQRTPCVQWSCRGRNLHSPHWTEWGLPHTEGKTGWTLQMSERKKDKRGMVESFSKTANIIIEYQTCLLLWLSNYSLVNITRYDKPVKLWIFHTYWNSVWECNKGNTRVWRVVSFVIAFPKPKTQEQTYKACVEQW